MKFFRRILLCLCFTVSCLCVSPAFALDGTITTPWGLPGQVHDGIHDAPGRNGSHDGLDIGADAGSPIDSPISGVVQEADYNDDYGYCVAIYNKESDICMLFAHMMSQPPVSEGQEIKQGDIIGYVGSTGRSTGPHCHVLLHRGQSIGGDMAEVSQNPYETLVAAGWNLTGNPGDKTGSGVPDLPWGIKELHNLGTIISKIIKDWSLIANKAFEYLRDGMFTLAAILCIIDFCLPLVIGMSTSIRDCAIKVMKYSGLLALIWNWNKFTDMILLNFATTVAGKAAGAPDLIAENMSNPQLLLQQEVKLIEPGLNKLASFTTFEYMTNLGSIIPMYFFCALALIAMVALALFMMLTYLEFYISASLSIVSVPFSAWKMTKFIPEGMVGHLVSATFKLLLVSMMVATCATGIKDLHPEDMFKSGPVQEAYDPNGTLTPATPDSPGLPSMQGSEQLTDAQLECIAWINEAAAYYKVPADWMVAMAWQESTMGEGSSNVMQITGRNDGYDPNTHTSFIVNDYYDVNDPKGSIFAGAAVFADKLYNYANGDIEQAVIAYNGGGDPGYLEHVKAQAREHNVHLKGGHVGITSEQLVKFIMYCLGLIAIAYVTMKVPKTIVKYFGGKIELP